MQYGGSMKSFDGKVAAITGAGSGMGRELALELARSRCALALSDVNDAGLEETVAAARALGVKVTAAHVDVAQRQAVYDWAAQVVRDHGRVNLIFNNAGVALTATLESVSQEDFEWLIGINLWGVIYGTQAFLPHLKAAGDGHIVNTSSLAGLYATAGLGSYTTSKFAVRGYTETLRIELDLMRCGVSATCVHPGGIRTNIVRASRIADSTRDLFGPNLDAARERFDKVLSTTSANQAARAILRGVRKNRRRVLIGPDARLMHFIGWLCGAGYQRIAVLITRMLRER